MSSWQQRLYETYCGCCISEEKLRSREIDRQIAEDRVRSRQQINVLLLGTPKSGKSTFLTQATILYGKDFDNDELKEFRPIVYGEIFKAMMVLADARRKLRLEWQNPSNQQHEDQILNFQLSRHIDTEKFMSYFDSIKSLWMDKAIQDAYEGRGEFQLMKSSEYFLKHLDRVGHLEYLPSKVDALYAKTARSHGGPIECQLIMDNFTFNITHIGDIDFTRKRFIKTQVFENVTAILFVVSCIEYDELTNGTWNCLVDSCDFFYRIINSPFFAHKSVILFFTKADILEEKVKRSNIKDYFPDFHGDPRKLEDVQSFIFQMFDDKRQDKSKVLYHSFTKAGNTEYIRYFFDAIKDIIMKDALKSLETK